jgi:hypothetical protein
MGLKRIGELKQSRLKTLLLEQNKNLIGNAKSTLRFMQQRIK